MIMVQKWYQLTHFVQLVGKKAKGQISKRWLQENKACQISRKTNISYPNNFMEIFFKKSNVQWHV